MLERIKKALRISSNTLDAEITGYMKACLADLRQYGVDPSLVNQNTTDELIISAVIHYCRWQFNFEGNAERYEKMYKDMYQVLSLRGDYNGSNE